MIAAVDGVDTSDAQRRAGDTLASNMTYQEWAGWKKSNGQSAGSETTKPGVPVHVGTVDFSDKKAVSQQLSNAEKELADYDYEVNYTVTADGKVWRTSGEAGAVNPSAIPSSLKGSYSYHNHPAAKTNYSFSAEDVAFFLSSGEEFSAASDDLYRYYMIRTADTVEKSHDEVYNRFDEIFHNDVFELQWKEAINPDKDSFHETVKILCKELGISYEREKKDRH